MSYKDILVYLDPTSDTRDRILLAANLAKTHEARVIGVDATASDRLVGDIGEAALVFDVR